MSDHLSPQHNDGNGSAYGEPRPITSAPSRQLRTESEASQPHTSDGRIRVALVNDYELVLRGLHAMLQPFGDRVVVIEHEVGGSPDSRADVALFDTFAARRDALARAKTMLDEGTVDHVVLYTWDAPEEFLQQAEAIGVDAVITKSTSAAELVRSLERVVAGERVGLETVVKGERSRHNGAELTVREQEVLALLALGLSNAEIAHELFLSVDTIKTHVRRVFTKLGVNNRTQAAMRAVDPSGGLGRAGAGRHGPG
jgi:DNA-binding NarL/FixJ family response regulator